MLDDALQPVPDRLSLVHGFGSRQSCELSRGLEREFERKSPEVWRELQRKQERDLERTFGPERWPEVQRELERKWGHQRAGLDRVTRSWPTA